MKNYCPARHSPVAGNLQKKRKESTLRLSDASFVKHDYAKPDKKKMKKMDDYDPRPQQFRGTASERLPELLNKIKGEQLGISLLLDPQFQCEEDLTSNECQLRSIIKLKETIKNFKASLQVTAEKAREIERNTHQQRNSQLWFSVRRYRITSSLFGAVLSRKDTTQPDSLVLRIIQPRALSTPAIQHGINHENLALKEYIKYKSSLAETNNDLIVTPSGFRINPSYSCLGSSPDGAVYDPSNTSQPYGFLEIKCPYTCRNVLPVEACTKTGFYCTLKDGKLELKRNHQYYAQVQGQMGIGERPWCDFVIYTTKGISVERILLDEKYWKEKLLPKLNAFYDNCVAPELVSPLHVLGLPMRDLSKM